MKIEIPTLILSVIISMVIMIAFPDWARKQVQRFTPWGGEATDTVKPAAEGVEIGAVWSSCEV